MANNVYTADGGVTITPNDKKSDSLFGGGILGGLGLEPYLNDYSLVKTYEAQPNYQPVPKAKEETQTNYLLIGGVVIGSLLFLKLIFK